VFAHFGGLSNVVRHRCCKTKEPRPRCSECRFYLSG
jgi:hypothetical protein